MTAPGLLVLGNVNVDLVLGEVDGWPRVGTEIMVERAETRAGGSAGNTALALAGLSAQHLLIASAGDDLYGDGLKQAFDPASCRWLASPGTTTVTVGIVHRGGDRAFFTTPGHLDRADAARLIAALPAAPDAASWALVSGSFLMPDLTQRGADLLRALAERGWQSAIDPGWPPQGWTLRNRELFSGWLGLAGCVLVNAEEAMAFSDTVSAEAAAARLRHAMRDDAILVIKQGPDGASAFSADQHWQAASPHVEVIDTVGAGDTFNAGFLHALRSTGDIRRALESGTAAAARAISTYPRRYV